MESRTQRTFREFEQALRRIEPSAGREVSLRDRLDSIVSSRQRRRVWQELRAAGWELPALRRSAWVVFLSTLLISTSILGPRFGLVRGLYFDKPPGDTWTLHWHKDLTIAVRDNRLASPHFRRPTMKAGVPHVEASQTVLETMLIARVHLDDATAANGPMRVIPGSHRAGKILEIDEAKSRPVLARRGDVLLIRPLVAHNSTASQAGNRSHRRILHLEFAGEPNLPDGFAWHDFVPGREGVQSDASRLLTK